MTKDAAPTTPPKEKPYSSLDLNAWESKTLAKSLDRLPRRENEFKTLSGLPIKDLYTHENTS